MKLTNKTIMSAIRVIANVSGILLSAPVRLPLKLLNALKYVRVGAEVASQIEIEEEVKPEKRTRKKKVQNDEHEQ
jgi:hypothetical protein